MKLASPISIKFFGLALLSALLSTNSTIPAASASPRTGSGKAQVQAMAILDQSAKAYGALEGLSMHGAYRSNSEGEILKGTSTIAFEKSGRMRITYAILPDPIVYSVASKDPKVGRATLARNIEFGAGPASLPLQALVQGRNPLRQASVKMMDNTFVWGKKPRLLAGHGVAVRFSIPAEPDLTKMELQMYFDPGNHLLRRVDIKGRVEGEKAFQSITFSQIQINPQFPEGTFVKPKPVEPKRVRKVYWDPKIKVGSKPYPLLGANLEEYRGRVVLLDFWATWCGPCVKEIPGLLSSYQKYHKEGLEIIGISRDTDKSSLAKFVQARKLPWKQVFDNDYGKSSNKARYGVTRIPFLLLIGKDGNVAAVNPRGEELEPAIKKALAQ